VKGYCYINGFKMNLGVTQVVYAPVTHPAMVIKLPAVLNNEECSTSQEQPSVDFTSLPGWSVLIECSV